MLCLIQKIKWPVDCFQNGGRPPSWIFDICFYWSRHLCLHVILLPPSTFCVNRTIWRWLRYSIKTIFKMASVSRLGFVKYKFFSCDSPRNQNSYLHTKFGGDRLISGWDIANKPFWKWRPSAILNFQNLLFWSSDLCLYVILLPPSKFRINRTIWLWALAKNIFKMPSFRHLGFVVTSSYCIR